MGADLHLPADEQPPRRPDPEGPPPPATLKLNRIRATRRVMRRDSGNGPFYIQSPESARRMANALVRFSGGVVDSPPRRVVLSQSDFAPPGTLPVEPNPELLEQWPEEQRESIIQKLGRLFGRG